MSLINISGFFSTSDISELYPAKLKFLGNIAKVLLYNHIKCSVYNQGMQLWSVLNYHGRQLYSVNNYQGRQLDTVNNYHGRSLYGVYNYHIR